MQPGGVPDFSQIMAQAQQMQEQLLAAQAELSTATVTGQAGGGLVTVTMSGAGAATAVSIDPKVIDRTDPETLEDLVLGAILDAQQQLGGLAEEAMGPLAGGLGALGLPGLGG